MLEKGGVTMCYEEVADELLQFNDYTYLKSPLNGDFGIEMRRDYSGLMASGKVKRPKQGLFDFVVVTGTRYGSKITHKAIFSDLMNHSDLDQCLRVWQRKDPRTIARNTEEAEALATLSLLMLEQEVNWGNEIWQKWSNFAPVLKDPSRRRPRDMIMGFVRQSFELGIEGVRYWMTGRKAGTASFSPPDEYRTYRDYPDEYKRFFSELEGTEGCDAFMVGEYLYRFREVAGGQPDNPKC
jgi:hypothetical protein